MHDVTFVAAARGQIRGQACGKIANCQAFRCQRLHTARRTRLTRITCISVSLVALASLGDRVGFGLGVPAGVGVRLLHLPLFTRSLMLILVSCSFPGGTTTLCSVGVGLITVCFFFVVFATYSVQGCCSSISQCCWFQISQLVLLFPKVSNRFAVVHRSEPVPVCQSVVFHHPLACSSPFQVHPSACSSLVSVQPFCQSLFSALLGLPLPFALLAFSFSIFFFSCAFGQRIDLHLIIFVLFLL